MVGDITSAAALIRAGDLDPAELVAASVERLRTVEPVLQAFTVVDEQRALEQAEALSREARAGHVRGPLHGIPVGVKDIFDVAGMPTRYGSRIYAGAPPATGDSTVARRLRDAGAVIVGKTTTHEFAFGVSTPPTRNPWDLSRSPGGSSGGSGAAVSAGLVMAATGSDTGGSIRTPSALCGVVGLKPSYGRASRAGALPLSWSLDHAGALTRTVADAGLVLQVLAGPDRADPTTLGQPRFASPSFDGGSLAGRTFGIVHEAFLDHVEAPVGHAFEEATALARELGATVVDVPIPELRWALAAELAILIAEAASHHEEHLRLHADEIASDIRAELEAGFVLPASAYLRAQRTRAAIVDAFERAFDDHSLDAILAPTVPHTAHLLDQQVLEFDGSAEEAGQAYVRTTGPANLAGLPAIALPFELSRDGLPTSVQLIARRWEEADLLRIAHAFHAATPWGPAWRPAVPVRDALR